MSKPMQVYNGDELGVSVVHKPCKVVAELGRRNVYSITAAERGKTHTIVACFSASARVCTTTYDGLSTEEECARALEGRCCSKHSIHK